MESRRKCRKLYSDREEASKVGREKIHVLRVVLLLLLLPTVAFSYAELDQGDTRMVQFQSESTEFGDRILRKQPVKGQPPRQTSDSEDRPREPTPAPGGMDKPSLGEKDPSGDLMYSFDMELSAALFMDPLDDGGTKTQETELTSKFSSALEGIIKALHYIITEEIGYYLREDSEDDSYSGSTSGDEEGRNSTSSTNRRFIVVQKAQSVKSSWNDKVDGVSVTWLDAIVKFSLHPDRDRDRQLDAISPESNVFEDRRGRRPSSGGDRRRKEPERSIRSHLQELRRSLMNMTMSHIQDGAFLEWVKYEDDRAVGVAMDYDDNHVMFMDFGDITKPNGTQPVDEIQPIFPFNDPLDPRARDPLQKIGFALFWLTTVTSVMLCLLSGKRSMVRGKSKGASAKLGTEIGINDLLECSDQHMPPQYRCRRDEYAPTLVVMPSDQWENPAALYPDDPMMQQELQRTDSKS